MQNELYQIPAKYLKSKNPYLKEEVAIAYNRINKKLDKKTGLTLQMLFDYDEENYVIGIHRTCHDYKRMFEKGIDYNDESPYLHDHVQIFDSFPIMLNEISKCNNYKGSTGCIIVKIPKNSIKMSAEGSTPIYYKSKSDNNIYLMPNFVSGYVPVRGGVIQSIILNEMPHNIEKDIMDVYFDESIYNNHKRLGFVNIIIISLLIITICAIIFIILK